MTTNEEIIKLGLAMLELKGFGRAKVRACIEKMQQIPNTPIEAANALENYIQETGKTLPEFNKNSLGLAMDIAELTMLKCAENEINIDYITANDERTWVRRYASIPSAPLFIFSLGDTSVIDMPTIAIIGTRNPTSIGRTMAKSVARKSVNAGFCVVSGLAMGCDIEAHKSTLENNGKTAAVLAHGLDEVHPTQHTEIARQIIEQGGCLLSEYSPGTPIERGNFVERDRLQSGASLGVLVIETSLNGGSMHTVRFGEKQNRRIACLDHPIKYHEEESVKGNRQLIKNKAEAIWNESSMECFLEELNKSASKEYRKPEQELLI